MLEASVSFRFERKLAAYNDDLGCSKIEPRQRHEAAVEGTICLLRASTERRAIEEFKTGGPASPPARRLISYCSFGLTIPSRPRTWSQAHQVFPELRT